MTASVSAKLALVLGFASGCLLSGQPVEVKPLLKGIEKRYNNTQTLSLNFTESYVAKGRKRVEKGTLVLRKPGKMRWQYTDGKLFVSDGSVIYSYFPDEKRVEKTKFKETDDLRAPLAFLLGKLDFERDFSEFRATPDANGVAIVATPKSNKLPYSEVSFFTTRDFVIRRLTIKNTDNTTIEFQLDGEKWNPPVADSEFRFTPPTGVELVDLTR